MSATGRRRSTATSAATPFPACPKTTRRDYLNDYLQHPLVLAGAGPPSIETARSYLANELQPARERSVGTRDRLRLDDGARGADGRVRVLPGARAPLLQRDDRPGAGPLGVRLGAEERGRHPGRRVRRARSGLVLDRLAAAIRDSAETPDPADPGSAACGPPGQSTLLRRGRRGSTPERGLEVVQDLDAARARVRDAGADDSGRNAVGGDEPRTRHELRARRDDPDHARR